MKITEMKNRIVLKAESGMWITNTNHTIFSKQVVTAPDTQDDFYEITTAEKERIEEEMARQQEQEEQTED